MELASIAEVPPILCKDKQRCFACQGQKSVLRAVLCPQEEKEKHRSSKSYNKEVAVQGGFLLCKGIRHILVNYLLNVIAKVRIFLDTTNAARSLIDAAVF